MPFHALITGQVLPLVMHLVDEPPQPEDVKAGWTAFAIFIGLGVAVALLGWSLVRQLKKAQAAQDAGVYDDPDAARPGRPVEGPAQGQAQSDAPAPADTPVDSEAEQPENHGRQSS
ncbi:hypothetical protein [Nocardioides ungokensis]